MSKYSQEVYENLKYGARAMDAMTTLFANPKIEAAMRKTARRRDWVGPMVENEPDAVIELIAAYRKQEPETAAEHSTPMTVFAGLMAVFGDPEMEGLFTSAGLKKDSESSGSLTESTEDRA